MILDYERKILEHNLFQDGTIGAFIPHTISGWINHAQSIENVEGEELDKLIKIKIQSCLKRMVSEYESVNGEFTNNPTDEEKVNIIISQEGYKNRNQKEEDVKIEFLQKTKDFIIKNCNAFYENETEKQTKIDEINACLTPQELNPIHIDIHFKLLKKKSINVCNIFILNEVEKQNKINAINACIDVKSMDLIVNELKNKYVI